MTHGYFEMHQLLETILAHSLSISSNNCKQQHSEDEPCFDDMRYPRLHRCYCQHCCYRQTATAWTWPPVVEQTTLTTATCWWDDISMLKVTEKYTVRHAASMLCCVLSSTNQQRLNRHVKSTVFQQSKCVILSKGPKVYTKITPLHADVPL